MAESLSTPSFSIVDQRAAYDVGAFQNYVAVHNLLDARDDPTRPADDRPILGLTFIVGALGKWPDQ